MTQKDLKITKSDQAGRAAGRGYLFLPDRKFCFLSTLSWNFNTFDSSEYFTISYAPCSSKGRSSVLFREGKEQSQEAVRQANQPPSEKSTLQITYISFSLQQPSTIVT